MIDVHAPHETPHGWRDFLLHLFTITIGLLIALSLEGLVEWQHHRHLAHDAEASLRAEITNNAAGMSSVLEDLHQKQAVLKKDVNILRTVIATGNFPLDHHMAVSFQIVGLDGVAWKTAQSTGALSYMPYDLAEQYSSIYSQQDLLEASESQAARDAIVTVGYFINDHSEDDPPTREQAEDIVAKMQVLQAQLMLVDSLMQGLNNNYKAYLSAHPN